MLCIGGHMDEQTLTTAAAVHRELRIARSLLAQAYPLLTRCRDLSALDEVQATELAIEIRKLLDGETGGGGL